MAQKIDVKIASVVAHLNPNVVANAVWKHIVTIVSYILPVLSNFL